MKPPHSPETFTHADDWALLLANMVLLAGVIAAYAHVGGSAMSGRIDGGRFLIWADGQYQAVPFNAFLECFIVETFWVAMTGWVLVRCVRRSFPSRREPASPNHPPTVVALPTDGPSGNFPSFRRFSPESLFKRHESEKHPLWRAARHARRRRPTSRSDCGDSHARTRRARIGGVRP